MTLLIRGSLSHNEDMSKPSKQEEAEAPQTQEFFVPGFGMVEAEGIADVEAKLKELQEVGDGN